MVKEEQKQRASEGSRSWQLATTMARKEVSGAHNKRDIRGHNYSLWTSSEFSSTILLRLELKGNSLFLLFNKIYSGFFFSRLFLDLCLCSACLTMMNSFII